MHGRRMCSYCPQSVRINLLLPAPGSSIEDPEREETNAKTWTRFQELIVRHYVACNKNMKFCPYPSCTNIVSCPSASSKASLSTVVPIVSCGARGIGSDQDTSKSPQFGPGSQGKDTNSALVAQSKAIIDPLSVQLPRCG